MNKTESSDVRQLGIRLLLFVQRNLSLLIRMLLLIPVLLFSGVVAQTRSPITPKAATVAGPGALNLREDSSASHGAEPNAQAPLPWLRGGIPA